MLNALVIITPGFPKNEADSSCIPPQQLFVKALKKLNPDLNIIVLTLQYPFKRASYHWNGVEVIALGGKENGGSSRRLTWLRAWLKLQQLNKQYQLIGLLSFWLGESAYVAYRFSKKSRLPHYSWILGQDAKAGNKYVKRIKPEGQSLIALSDFIVKEFATNYHVTPRHVVPVGIDTTLFCPQMKQRHINVMGAGSLITLKQYDIFITTIALLKKQFPNIKALICGDGPERKKLQVMIDKLELQDNVNLLGELPHQEVLALMQQSKVFLHTSNYEGFGAVNLEALYAGAKVVSFVKPMDVAIPDWHIASDKTKMVQIATSILNDKDMVYQPKMVYSIEDNARRILALFNHNAAAIS